VLRQKGLHVTITKPLIFLGVSNICLVNRVVSIAKFSIFKQWLRHIDKDTKIYSNIFQTFLTDLRLMLYMN